MLKLLIILLLIQSCGGGESTSNPNTFASNNTNNSSTNIDGKSIFQSNCAGCHSIGTETKSGPGLGKLFGSTVTLQDESTVQADEAYIRESIITPSAKMPKGNWNRPMPSFSSMKAEEIDALVAYVKSLAS